MAKLCSPLSTSPRSSFLNDLMSRPCSFIDELSEHLDPYDILDELPSICGDIQKVEDDKNNNEFKYNYDYGCDYNFNSTAISDATDFGSINNYDLYDECDIKPNIMNIKLENDLMWPVLNSSLTTNDCHNTDMPAVPLAAITGRNVAGSQIVQGTGTVSVATAKVTSSANTITDSIVIKQEPIEVNCDSMKNASNGTSVVPLLQQASYNSNMESKIIVKNEILDDGYEQILKQQQQQQQRQQLENLNNIPPGTSLLRKSNVNNQQLTQQQLTQNRKIGTIIMQQQQHQQHQQQQRQLLVIQHHPHGHQQQQQQHHRKRDHLLSCSTRLAIIDNCDTSVTAITATTTNTSTTTATATTANLYQRPDTPHSLDDDCSATTSAMETATPTIITTTIIPTEFKHDIDLNTCVMGSNNISLSDSQYIQQVSQELRDINKEQIGTLRTNTDYTLNDILDVINTDVTTASTPALATTALKSQLLRHDYHRNFNINDSPSSSSSSSSSCCSSHNKSKFIIKSPITMNYPSLTINCNNINSKNFLVRQCNADVMLSSVINTNYNNNDDDDDAAAILTPLRTSECDTTDNDDDNDNDNDNEFYIDYINNNYTNDDEHEHEADADADDDDDDYEDNVSICESSTCSILDALNSPLSIVGATNASIVAAGASAVAGPTALTVSANSISPLISASTTKNRLTINSNNMNATRNLTNNAQKQQQQQQQQHLQYNNQQHMDHSYTRMDDISTNLDTPSDSEEEIDVVSINDRKLPTNPSDKDRRALQHKVAHKFSSRIVRSINGVRTIPPRRRGSYELPYTPVSSSPVKSVNNSRYPSPATTPYENQYTRKYVQQQQQLMKGNGSLTNIIVNGETTIATPINVLTEKSRKRLLLNHNQQHQQQQNKQQQQQQLAGTTLLTTTQLRNYKKISNNNNNNTDIITISDSFLHESNTTACNINVKKYRTKKGGANTVLTTNKQQQQQQGNYITGVTSNGGTLKRQYAAIDSETADTIEKRNLHNNMERQRRIGLKNLFDTLKKQIPSIKDKERAPKVTILREATKLCHNLTREDQYLMEEKLRLKENLLLLNRRYNQLKSVMSTAAESEEDIDVGVIMENDYGTFE